MVNVSTTRVQEGHTAQRLPRTCVDADAQGTQLHRQCFGERDQAPLGGGVPSGHIGVRGALFSARHDARCESGFGQVGVYAADVHHSPVGGQEFGQEQLWWDRGAAGKGQTSRVARAAA